jgi:hypothetical protein
LCTTRQKPDVLFLITKKDEKKEKKNLDKSYTLNTESKKKKGKKDGILLLWKNF